MTKTSSKLWTKNVEPLKLIEEFTVGPDRDLDMRLARHDVKGSMAHIKMLQSIGLLTAYELDVLTEALKEIAEKIERGEFEIEPDVEDIHSQVELLLTRKLGDVGKKIHSGRSRNDQVLVDLKLLMLADLKDIADHVLALFTTLQYLSEKHRDVLMPGYTHMQVAMPSSFGLWFGAYAETLVDDVKMLAAAYEIADQNPLGSAAGYGSSFPLDRVMTTRLLHFGTMHYNVVAAQMSRGKCERAMASAIAAIAATLGRLANDMCTYMCQNFAFISFPDSLTTGSSIMPHKKNPDVWEIMRGRCNMLQALPGQLALLNTNLPLGYNRDLQLMKEVLFPAVTTLISCMNMADFMLHHIQVNTHVADDPRYDLMFTVEEVNRRVLAGTPFREAYRQVGLEVAEGKFKPERNINHVHKGSIGCLCTEEIKLKMQHQMDKFVKKNDE